MYILTYFPNVTGIGDSMRINLLILKLDLNSILKRSKEYSQKSRI